MFDKKTVDAYKQILVVARIFKGAHKFESVVLPFLLAGCKCSRETVSFVNKSP